MHGGIDAAGRKARATRTADGDNDANRGKYGSGFMLLFAIGVLDTAVRMGLLTFLPFLLQAKGASLPTSGLALSLVFIGGAAGKFICGWLGERLGMLRTVLLTEGGTAVGILAVLALPLAPTMIAAAAARRDAERYVLGAIRNGAGTCAKRPVGTRIRPVLHRDDRIRCTRTRLCYGFLGDGFGPIAATVATAITAAAICPMAFALAARLQQPVASR